MDRALLFPGGGLSVAEMLTIAREAEAEGFDALYCVEAWRSALVPLTAIALSTERVRVGPYILNAFGTNPFIVGMAAIDLDELSGGRLVLPIGSGNRHINEDYLGVPHARPLRKMAEYIELLRQIVRTPLGGRVDYDGEIHRMHWSPAVAPVRPAIPVFMAGIYPGAVRVAGRVADGLAMGALISPAYARERIRPVAREAAEQADRDPDELRYLMALFVSVNDDPDAARMMVRHAICALYDPLPHPYYDFLLREQGFSGAADAAARHVPQGRPEAAMEQMGDDMIDALAVTGNAEQCSRRLSGYEGVIDEAAYSNVGAVAATLGLGGEADSSAVASWRALYKVAPAP